MVGNIKWNFSFVTVNVESYKKTDGLNVKIRLIIDHNRDLINSELFRVYLKGRSFLINIKVERMFKRFELNDECLEICKMNG